MKALSHENLNRFIGASLAEHPPVFVWAHTVRKSLETILFNEDIQLNEMIKASIVRDIVNVRFHLNNIRIIILLASDLASSDHQI